MFAELANRKRIASRKLRDAQELEPLPVSTVNDVTALIARSRRA